jgi:hypothetical protein
MVDLNKGATVALVKTLSDDIRTLPDETMAESAGAVTRTLTNYIKNIAGLEAVYHGDDFSPWESSKTLNAEGKIGASGAYSVCPTFFKVPDYVNTVRITTGAYGAIAVRYSGDSESDFHDRNTYTANHAYDLDVSEYKYLRFAVGSTDTGNVASLTVRLKYPLADSVSDLQSQTATMNSGLIKALSTDYSFASAVPNGTDYDTLTTPGNYYASSGSAAASMVHCPTSVAHRLIVMTTTAAARVRQFVIANDANNTVYYRTPPGAWLTLGNSVNSVQTKVVLDSSNYTDYFSDADNAPLNSVYSVRPNTPIANLPKGNSNVYGAGQTYGYPSGTLITFDGGIYTGSSHYATQMFLMAATDFQDNTNSNNLICTRNAYYVSGAVKWSKWSKMGEVMCLHSTNTSIQESRWQSGEADFTDFNNAPINTIYQIDLDCVSMLNDPLVGHSCILITVGFSFISRHGMMQLCCGIDNGAKLFFRYGYKQDENDYRWTDWQRLLTES